MRVVKSVAVGGIWVLLFAASCATTVESPGTYGITPLESRTSASLRGVSVVTERIAWASGTGGTVLRTTDGGATWQARSVPGADSLDFRDVEAFDEQTAYVLSAGEDGRIYKTMDGGATWKLQHRNRKRGAFFDCLAFWDERTGLAMSDPVDGRFLLLRTTDGETWQELPVAARPRADSGEAAFAASGTCIVTAGRDRAYLATGGGPAARVFVSEDRGMTWSVGVTPLPAGAASVGIFSLVFRDAMSGLALGGDYRNPAGVAFVAMTSNGGRSWGVAGRTAYVSGAAWRAAHPLVAVGPAGTRVSADRGVTWRTIDSVEYNAVQLAADGTGYAVGPRGRIARLVRR